LCVIMFIFMNIYIYTYIYILIYLRPLGWCKDLTAVDARVTRLVRTVLYIYLPIYLFIYIYIYICIYICVCVCMCVCVFIFIFINWKASLVGTVLARGKGDAQREVV